MEDRRARGIRTYIFVWLGQLVSMVGSGLSNFALGVWAYQLTESATLFTLIGVSAWLPGLLILPLAGPLADRWNRRRSMICSNIGAALATLALMSLIFSERLEVWHIYLAVMAISICSTFLSLVFTASTALLVPKEHFGRASGLSQTAQAIERIVPPLLAGVLVSTIQLHGLILIDFASYVFAIFTLLMIRIPDPEKAGGDGSEDSSFLRRATYGWNYVKARPGLLALMCYFAIFNLVLSFAQVLFTPMILSFASSQVLGTLLSISGAGFLIGSVIMSTWGGPKRRLLGILGAGSLFGLSVMLVGLTAYITLIAAAAFCMYLMIPIMNGCSQAIWLSKTSPEVQGRVFAIRWMVGYSTVPLAYLLAGPLADKVFEPLVAMGGPLSSIIGEGKGRGIGLIYLISGFLLILVQVGGLLHSRLRNVEEELPDAVDDRVFSEART